RKMTTLATARLTASDTARRSTNPSMARPASAGSLRPTDLGQIGCLRRRVDPQPFEPDPFHARLGKLEDVGVDEILRDIALEIAQQRVARIRVGGSVQFLPQRLELRRAIAEIIILAPVDLDIHRLG